MHLALLLKFQLYYPPLLLMGQHLWRHRVVLRPAHGGAAERGLGLAARDSDFRRREIRMDVLVRHHSSRAHTSVGE